MVSRIKVPHLKNSDIVIRLANSNEEIRAANELIVGNYLNIGLWADEQEFLQSKFHHSAARNVFVAVDHGKIVGTVSIVKDSENGLPADSFQPAAMKHLRAQGDRMAEVTALAIDKSASQDRALILFLYKFLYQYSFYYAGIDRFVASTTPRHAQFYETIFGFQHLSDPASYYYVRLDVQLLTVHLVRDRIQMAECYDVDNESTNDGERNFYHFLLIDKHPMLCFPERERMRRPRSVDWLMHAQHMNLPIAV
jgi:hypothetical protein